MRVGVIGAGIAGLATAWMLDDEHEVVLLERNEHLGGHAHTVEIELDDRGTPRTVPVDGGFQHFSSAMYPRFERFLDLLGVETFLSPVTCTMTWRGAARSGGAVDIDITPSARSLWRALKPSTLRLLLSLRRAIEAGEAVRSWSTTVDDYLRALPLPARFVDDVMGPFLAATLGTSAQEARRMSARAALRYPVAHQPESPLRPFLFREITGGSVSYVKAVLASLRQTTVRTGAEVVAIDRVASGGPSGTPTYDLVELEGRRTRVDRVVLAAPAWAAAPLVNGLGLERVGALLGRVESIATTMSVHRAHELMPTRQRQWASWNIEVRGGESEGTIWSGRHFDGPFQGGLDLFKSWVTIRGGPRRHGAPHHELRSLDYRHPLMTPDYFAAQEQLADLRGADGSHGGDGRSGGLYLAGSYLEDIDSHESGLGSALTVARHLAPTSARLKALVGGSAASSTATDDATKSTTETESETETAERAA